MREKGGRKEMRDRGIERKTRGFQSCLVQKSC
uniref:Uncharacterized protein n=1 Tax=Anguilla anguilla TaxID=7936 RepID=A0A0E9VK88_ANGAN